MGCVGALKLNFINYKNDCDFVNNLILKGLSGPWES